MLLLPLSILLIIEELGVISRCNGAIEYFIQLQCFCIVIEVEWEMGGQKRKTVNILLPYNRK